MDMEEKKEEELENFDEAETEELKELEEEELGEKILEYIQTKDRNSIKLLFERVPTIDIAQAMEDVTDITSLLYIIRIIGSEYSADFFSELTFEQQQSILGAFTDAELLKLLENSFADDIVDVVEDLPANMVHRILKVAPKELRKDINTLLRYEEDTAGSVMTTEYLEMKDSMTVQEVIDQVREKGKDAETVYTIFVKNNKRTMVGTVDLDDLIFAKSNQTLDEIMNKDYVTCYVNDDQEEVANMFKRYDLNAMAVVNKENKIVGIITIDDVVDIMEEEATEDIAHLNQVSVVEDEYLKTPVYKLFLKCVPWIICLMILQVFSTMILSRFDQALASFIILSVFTPLIMDAGGNSGGQTTTIIVRSIGLDEFHRGDYKKVIWKEFRVALLIAAVVAIFAFGWLMFEMAVGIVSTEQVMAQYPTLDKNTVCLIVSGLVSLTLFVTMLFSRLIGCSLPFLAKALKRDPAVMCGPLTTTLVDIVSLLTYFLLWTLVFAPIIGL